MVTSEFELTLNNPLTDEEWDMLTDADLDKTDRITFETKHGKHVEFAKVIRCKDCKYWGEDGYSNGCKYATCIMYEHDYCSMAERRTE